MGWTVFIRAEVDLGGPEPFEVEVYDGDYTFNVAPMYFEAFGDEVPRWKEGEEDRGRGGLRALDGMTCGGALSHLDRAIDRMTADPAKYRKWNPDNGWGDYDGALRFLGDIREACRSAPKAKVRVW